MQKCICTVFVAVGLLLTGGCSGNTAPETVLVSGTVTLDGAPLPIDGMITFRDVAGAGKAYAGKITDGEFSFPSTVGQKEVEITAERDVVGKGGTPGNPGDPVSQENPIIHKESIIPPKYKGSDALVANVVSSGPSEFKFDLVSK